MKKILIVMTLIVGFAQQSKAQDVLVCGTSDGNGASFYSLVQVNVSPSEIKYSLSEAMIYATRYQYASLTCSPFAQLSKLNCKGQWNANQEDPILKFYIDSKNRIRLSYDKKNASLYCSIIRR